MPAGAAEPRVGKEFLTWRRVIEWCLIPLAFILLRFVPQRPITLAQWLLLSVAALLFASPVVLSSYREYVKGQAARSAGELAVEYRLRLGLTLGEAITPMGDLLGRIAGGRRDERAVLLGQLRQRGVDATASLATPDRARAVFFLLDGKKLRPAAWAGRPEPPRAELAGGDPAGDAAYLLVERHDRILVRDTRDPEAVDFGLGGDYRTYLSVAVYAGPKNFGMLSVDAPEPESLEESDLDITTALAQTLGAGLAMA
jgi:hypothetical protein